MASFRTLIVPAAALALLAGCAPTFEARVARFQSLPAPSGQTFAIQAADKRKAGGLEFSSYANTVRQRLLANGFAESGPGSASLVVILDYGVGAPREKIETRPGFGYGGFGGGFGGGYGGYGGYGGFGGHYGGFHGWRSRFYPGYWGYWDDPFFSYPEVTSTTQYNSFVDLRIVRAADNGSVFEGRAETVSTSNDLTKLVPNLVTAIFTNFPGNSGETVRVRFDPSRPDKPAMVSRGR